jgi:hypothetical protein
MTYEKETVELIAKIVELPTLEERVAARNTLMNALDDHKWKFRGEGGFAGMEYDCDRCSIRFEEWEGKPGDMQPPTCPPSRSVALAGIRLLRSGGLKKRPIGLPAACKDTPRRRANATPLPRQSCKCFIHQRVRRLHFPAAGESEHPPESRLHQRNPRHARVFGPQLPVAVGWFRSRSVASS